MDRHQKSFPSPAFSTLPVPEDSIVNLARVQCRSWETKSVSISLRSTSILVQQLDCDLDGNTLIVIVEPMETLRTEKEICPVTR